MQHVTASLIKFLLRYITVWDSIMLSADRYSITKAAVKCAAYQWGVASVLHA